jgi:hypothetical protein
MNENQKRVYEHSTDDEPLLYADGFADAIIGTGTRCGQPTLVVYSRTKCLQILMKQGMSAEEAIEHLEFNVIGAWVGDNTPIFVDDEPQEEDGPFESIKKFGGGFGNDGKKWPQTMDANVWAIEFCKLNSASDHGTMIGWFANAIMIGFDTANWRNEKERKHSEAEVCCGDFKNCQKRCVPLAKHWKQEAEANQAKIDALMLEHCPNEMPREQVNEWSRNQRPVSTDEQAAIDRIVTRIDPVGYLNHSITTHSMCFGSNWWMTLEYLNSIPQLHKLRLLMPLGLKDLQKMKENGLILDYEITFLDKPRVASIIISFNTRNKVNLLKTMGYLAWDI